MSKKDKGKQEPTTRFSPQSGIPKFERNPLSTDSQTPAWQFHRCDENHDLWGWNLLPPNERLKIIHELHEFEKMTWQTIKGTSGGRSCGTNHHSLPVEEFIKSARDRLIELKLDDISELFSLRLRNKTRIYGVKDGRALKILWYDIHHGTKKGAYPTGENRKKK